jgi:hypothetical protein
MTFPINLQSFKPVSASIPSVSSTLEYKDYLGSVKVRWGIGRDSYTVTPGLYKIGNPHSDSDVFVSANYKLSFDTLRKNLTGIHAWILVIDTKGVNVWCAAGKGTFSTENLINSIKNTSLEQIVKHRRIIVPQLAAPGIAAHIVKERSGFKVIYGPVRAKDIKKFIQEGYKATPAMRRIFFPLKERAKLVPVDLLFNKYKLLIAIGLLFILSGLTREGIIFSKILETSPYPIINIVGAYIAGIVLAPILLPYAPFRVFALKGAFWSIIFTILLKLIWPVSNLEFLAIGLMNLSLASFMSMNFTGSSTYTSLSGVKKEMKWAVPCQILFAFTGIILFIVFKLS